MSALLLALVSLSQYTFVTATAPVASINDADCPASASAGDICVIPSAGSGTCFPACSLTSDVQPCDLGQACETLPQVSIMQTGYCPDPDQCGGFFPRPCVNARNPVCIDDPRDSCDSNNGGADCGGICVVGATSPTLIATPPQPTLPTRPPATQFCGGFFDVQCSKGYTCEDDPGDGCDPKHGGVDCPGHCVKERICDTRGVPPCRKGEQCVHEPGCSAAVDCPGVCRAKKKWLWGFWGDRFGTGWRL